MLRLLLVTCLAAAACGTSPDERPATFEFVTLAILAPSCGQVQCHSTTTQLEGLAFDTLDAAKQSLIDLGANQPGGGELLFVLHASGEDRMPPDSPLADQDIALVEKWVAAGAPGL